MKTPDWWVALLLFGGAFRVYRLIAKDVILDRPRAFLLGLGEWRPGTPTPATYREHLAEFVTCPWCMGLWVTLGWWLAWQQWPHAVTVVSVPLAINTAVGLVAKLDSDD
jgi:hypothetical protein